MRTASDGMCSKESGIDSKRMFIGDLRLLASCCASFLPRVVEDDAEGVARARAHPAHAVAHGGPVVVARPGDRPVAGSEDHQLALLRVDHLTARLGARSLLHEQELAASVVDPAPTQEAGELEREGHLAVEILVEAVVAARLVV